MTIILFVFYKIKSIFSCACCTVFFQFFRGIVLMSTKLFAGNLPWAVTDEVLKTAFESYGPVVSAKVVTDRQTGKSRGFGFVEMQNEAEADAAIKALNGSVLAGRNIIVNEAKPQK
jgi:cold-inducible RNA-binding protein